MATGSEVDLTVFHTWAQSAGKKLAFPVSSSYGRMEAMVPCDNDAWEKGRYGIMAPLAEHSYLIQPEDIDVVLVP